MFISFVNNFLCLELKQKINEKSIAYSKKKIVLHQVFWLLIFLMFIYSEYFL